MKVVGITSVNCEQWICTDLATNLLGLTSVPLYETLGSQAMSLILQQTEITTVFGSDKCLRNIVRNAFVSKADGGFLENFVVFDQPSDDLISQCRSAYIRLLGYRELIEEQEEDPEF